MDHVLTLVAGVPGALTGALLARIVGATGGAGPTILSQGEAADIPLARPPDSLALADALAGAPIDAIVQPAAHRRKRLLVADMDSTLVEGETLDALAALAGIGERVAAITARSMNGEIDFAAALRERVALLRGQKVALLDRVPVRLNPGAATLIATMRAHGAFTALVSGGFTHYTARAAALAGIDHHRGNTLLHDGDTLLGTVAEPILGGEAKRVALLELAAAHGIPIGETLAVGDGANDLPMLRAAGLGIAYRAKPVVAATVPARLDHVDLRALLFIQGIPAERHAGVG